MTDKERIQEAIAIALEYSQIDGSDHKMWVIDQMVQTLAGEDYNNTIANVEYWETGTAP